MLRRLLSSFVHNKRVIPFFIVLMVFAPFIAAAESYTPFFNDMEGHWGRYYAEKMHVICPGINGYADQTGNPLHIFGPDSNVTRAELARMLSICGGKAKDSATAFQQPFSDVPMNVWYTQDVIQANNHGWMKGYADGAFRPDHPINRAEASASILRFGFPDSALQSTASAFKDVAITHWFGRYIGFAFDHGYIHGLTDRYGQLTGYFGPEKTLTRAQAAKIIVNLLDDTRQSYANPSLAAFHEWAIHNNLAGGVRIGVASDVANLPKLPTLPTLPKLPSPFEPPTKVYGGGGGGGGGGGSTASTDPQAPDPQTPDPQAPDPQAPILHPSMWLTAEDLPKLRSWAVASNPVYEDGLKSVAEGAKQHMDSGLLSQDPGACCGTQSYPREAYAMLFAFMSLIENDQAVRDDYAARAKSLLMYVINEAAKGPANLPYRSPAFSRGDRAHFWGESFPLTVDWIYPYLSANEKSIIRNVFIQWIEEIEQNAIYYPNQNDPSNLYLNEPGKGTYRFGINNHFTLWARQVGMMAMSFDPADDPNGTLRSYLPATVNSSLYRTWHVIKNDINPGNNPGDPYNGKSGDWLEGFQYAPSGLGNTIGFLLADETKSELDPSVGDPSVLGSQINLLDDSFFKNLIDSYLHSMSPKATVQDATSWYGPSYQPAWYGDGQKYFLEGSIKFLGPLALYYQLKGDNAMVEKIRWIELHYGLGGVDQLTYRIQNNLSSFSLRNPILAFMMFDPEAMEPSDPRPGMPTLYFGKGGNRLLARTSWNEDANWFTYKLSWNQIDHQHGDGNMFEFYRKGEWLTKNRVGYGYVSAGTDWHNGVTIKNDPPTINNPGSFQNTQWLRGSQYQLINTEDPAMVSRSFKNDFVYLTGDATNLYNSASSNSMDVAHASRSIVWLKPDHVVIYDRAATHSAGKFKRFWLNFQNEPVINGNVMSAETPEGQNIYVTSLLPQASTMSIDNSIMDGLGYDEEAEGEIMAYRLKVEATGDPLEARFLHVLQGADAGVSVDSAFYIQSSAGTPYDGVVMGGAKAILFPVTLASVTTLTYTVPDTVTKHIVTGLANNVGYTVGQQDMGNGEMQITITVGGSSMSDGGGVLVF